MTTEICKETCFVIDRSPKFSSLSGAKLKIDTSLKNRSTPSFLSTLEKSIWTCIVEGVIEYCRIVYDILSADFKILVISADENVFNINELEDKYQSIHQVLKGFGELGPPKESLSSTSSIFLGVARAGEELLKPSISSTKCSKRVIVITSIDEEEDARSISNVIWEIQNDQDKERLCFIDLLVVNISDNEISYPKREVSSNLSVTVVTFQGCECAFKIPLLTRRHYYLKSTIITGIPMKEEQHAGTSANYDVEVIHSAAAHHDIGWLRSLNNSSYNEVLQNSSVTLKWCTPKANSLQDIQPCVGVYRVTPSEVNSRPAACLIMFLLQGRTVMLEQPKKSGAKVLTHMLNSHGGDIYIHVLASGRSQFEEPPSITEGIGGRVTDYRVTDFGRFMEDNRLAPYLNEGDEKPNLKAIERLKRYSNYWPLVICDTYIFNMYSNLEPLMSLMLKPTLSEDEVQECKKVIYRLQSMESRKDALPLPIVTLKGKGSKREEQYQQVWEELDRFIESSSTTSNMHKKVLDCLRGHQDATSTVEPTSPKDSSVDNPKEKKDDQDNDRRGLKEAPSDPRRRRRVSESMRDPHPTLSPKQEEPPSKMRRASSRNALNTVTSQHPIKSSLLSIWANQMDLTTSRYHEEFLGRKMSVNANSKYELYQEVESTGQSDTKYF